MKLRKLALVTATSILLGLFGCSTSSERAESESSTLAESSHEMSRSSDDQWKNSKSRKDPRGNPRRAVDRAQNR